MNNLIILFSLITMINVVLSTIKSIVTIKCNKIWASVVSGLYYGYYNIVMIYTVSSSFSTESKVIITTICNLFGVYFVKLMEEKATKDKLWKIEFTLPQESNWKEILELIKTKDIPCNYNDLTKYIEIRCFCESKEQSKIIKDIINENNAKHIVIESKRL